MYRLIMESVPTSGLFLVSTMLAEVRLCLDLRDVVFFFSLLDTTLVFFFYLWLARRLQLTRSHVLLAVHSPSGGVPNGTSEIHAQDDL